jgi:hypothetical protein
MASSPNQIDAHLNSLSFGLGEAWSKIDQFLTLRAMSLIRAREILELWNHSRKVVFNRKTKLAEFHSPPSDLVLDERPFQTIAVAAGEPKAYAWRNHRYSRKSLLTSAFLFHTR